MEIMQKFRKTSKIKNIWYGIREYFVAFITLLDRFGQFSDQLRQIWQRFRQFQD